MSAQRYPVHPIPHPLNQIGPLLSNCTMTQFYRNTDTGGPRTKKVVREDDNVAKKDSPDSRTRGGGRLLCVVIVVVGRNGQHLLSSHCAQIGRHRRCKMEIACKGTYIRDRGWGSLLQELGEGGNKHESGRREIERWMIGDGEGNGKRRGPQRVLASVALFSSFHSLILSSFISLSLPCSPILSHSVPFSLSLSLVC